MGKMIGGAVSTFAMLALFLGIGNLIAVNDRPDLWAEGGNGVANTVITAEQAGSYVSGGWWLIGIGLVVMLIIGFARRG